MKLQAFNQNPSKTKIKPEAAKNAKGGAKAQPEKATKPSPAPAGS